MQARNIVENDLVLKAQRGDEAASKEIVERMKAPLMGFLYRLLGPGHAGQMEDIAQDIFLKVFHTIDRFDVDRGVKFSTWAFTYARNHCVDLLKKKRLPMVDLTVSRESQFGSSLVDRRVVQPSRALESVEIRERYEDAMRAIPSQHRDVLTLRELGLNYPEIAARLGVASGTIKSRLHRARAALRRQLSNLNPAPAA